MSDEPATTPATTPSGGGSGTGSVQWLPGTFGVFGVVVAAIAVAGLVLIAAPSLTTAPGVATLLLAAFVAIAGWVVLLRPRLGLVHQQVRGTSVPSGVVLRGMVSSVVVPLVEVTSVDLRQTLIVVTGERRWHSPALSRSRRELSRGKRRPGDTGAGFVVRTGPWGNLNAPDASRAPSTTAGEIVLARLDGARRDAALHRVPGGPATRTWAWLELAGLTVTAVGAAILFAI